MTYKNQLNHVIVEFWRNAGIATPNLAKVEVVSSNIIARYIFRILDWYRLDFPEISWPPSCVPVL